MFTSKHCQIDFSHTKKLKNIQKTQNFKKEKTPSFTATIQCIHDPLYCTFTINEQNPVERSGLSWSTRRTKFLDHTASQEPFRFQMINGEGT